MCPFLHLSVGLSPHGEERVDGVGAKLAGPHVATGVKTTVPISEQVGEKRRLLCQDDVVTSDRPQRLHKKPDCLVVGDMRDPLFNRHRGG